MDPAVSQALMTGRYQGDETKKDIHEADVAYLMQARRAADYCAKVLGWHVVECVADGAMRTVDDIAAEILAALTEG